MDWHSAPSLRVEPGSWCGTQGSAREGQGGFVARASLFAGMKAGAVRCAREALEALAKRGAEAVVLRSCQRLLADTSMWRKPACQICLLNARTRLVARFMRGPLKTPPFLPRIRRNPAGAVL